MQGIVCSFCKSGNAVEDHYCTKCGAPLPVWCPKCQRDIPRHLGTCECCEMPRETKPLTHCPDCGTELEDLIAEKKQPGPKSRRQKART